MNLGDPNLELIDPTPNVYNLFVRFDARFFWGKLASVVVRWSKKMYSCAGVCRYSSREGLCDIALSEPLLKLRPRKDLVETLLHEMIHAYLFITNNDRDRDGHGPNFQMHMYRINKEANVNITIYHSFHDEVRLYQTHWWRCNGPCQHQKPYFGTVRRSSNRAPGPSDFWWKQHQATCGGTFMKIKEPDKKLNKKTLDKPKENIVKYIQTSPKITTLKDLPSTSKILTKSNGSNTLTNKNPNNLKEVKPHNFFTQATPNKTGTLWSSKGKTLNQIESTKSDNNVIEIVRNVWANKNIMPFHKTPPVGQGKKRPITSNFDTPGKIPKINEFFVSTPKTPSKEKTNEILRNIYGENFTLYEISSKVIKEPQKSPKGQSLTPPKQKNQSNNSIDQLVTCPLCNNKVKNIDINEHVDLCLIKSNPELLKDSEIIDLTHINTSCSQNIKTSESNNDIKNGICYDNHHLVKSNTETKLKDKECNNNVSDEFKIPCCPVCSRKFNTSIEEHLDDCLSGIDNNESIPIEGASFHSILNEMDSQLVDGDNEVDESNEFNATGTMYPCPYCMKMVEGDLMNGHLEKCFNVETI